MRLTLAKLGGFGAGMRRLPFAVETQSLPEGAARELAGLVRAAAEETVPAQQSGVRVPDEMTYKITIEDQDKTISLSRSDTNMTPAFADLLKWLDSRQRSGGEK
jgi:Emfourin